VAAAVGEAAAAAAAGGSVVFDIGNYDLCGSSDDEAAGVAIDLSSSAAQPCASRIC
jgi:hypothetical protein